MQLRAAAVAGCHQPLTVRVNGQHTRCGEVFVDTVQAQSPVVGTAGTVAVENGDRVFEATTDIDVIAIGRERDRPGPAQTGRGGRAGVDGLVPGRRLVPAATPARHGGTGRAHADDTAQARIESIVQHRTEVANQVARTVIGNRDVVGERLLRNKQRSVGILVDRQIPDRGEDDRVGGSPVVAGCRIVGCCRNLGAAERARRARLARHRRVSRRDRRYGDRARTHRQFVELATIGAQALIRRTDPAFRRRETGHDHALGNSLDQGHVSRQRRTIVFDLDGPAERRFRVDGIGRQRSPGKQQIG